MSHSTPITEELIYPAVAREEIERGKDAREKNLSEVKSVETPETDQLGEDIMELSEIRSK